MIVNCGCGCGTFALKMFTYNTEQSHKTPYEQCYGWIATTAVNNFHNFSFSFSISNTSSSHGGLFTASTSVAEMAKVEKCTETNTEHFDHYITLPGCLSCTACSLAEV